MEIELFIWSIVLIIFGVIIIIYGIISSKKDRTGGHALRGFRPINKENEPDEFFYMIYMRLLIGILLTAIGITILCCYFAGVF